MHTRRVERGRPANGFEPREVISAPPFAAAVRYLHPVTRWSGHVPEGYATVCCHRSHWVHIGGQYLNSDIFIVSLAWANAVRVRTIADWA
jgi:hypothetical protein